MSYSKTKRASNDRNLSNIINKKHREGAKVGVVMNPNASFFDKRATSSGYNMAGSFTTEHSSLMLNRKATS